MDTPYFFHKGKRFEAALGQKGVHGHFFGQSGLARIANPPAVGTVHQVLDLDLEDPVLGMQNCGLTRLPLFYCFNFEYGEMEYKVRDGGSIEITNLDQDGYDAEWPYQGYPESFPKVPFVLTQPASCTIQDFAQDVWQGIEKSEHEKFISIVPPSNHYGIDLWKRGNNADSISIKFFFDESSRTVRTYNECD